MIDRLGVSLVVRCGVAGSAAGATQCPDSGDVVFGGSDTEVGEVCRGVSELRGFLASIGIALPAAVTLRVVGGEAAPALESGEVGNYDGTRHEGLMRSCGEVATQAVRRLPDASSDDERGLAQLRRPRACPRGDPRVVHLRAPRRAEYVAAVAQFLSLPDELRAAILARHADVEPFGRESEISDVHCAIDPQRFAAKSWLHYRGPQGGPAFVPELLGVAGDR